MAVGAWIVSLPSAQGIDPISNMLKGVQERYNHTDSLQVSFAETYTNRGRKRVEKGELYMRKPGRMRWEYTSLLLVKLFGIRWQIRAALISPMRIALSGKKPAMKGDGRGHASCLSVFCSGKLEFEKKIQRFPHAAGRAQHVHYGESEIGQDALYGSDVPGGSKLHDPLNTEC